MRCVRWRGARDKRKGLTKEPLKFNGAAYRIRTYDALIRSQVLYPAEVTPRATSIMTELRIKCKRFEENFKEKPFAREKTKGNSKKWRRAGDSNPRWALGPYSLSRRAPSASRSALRNRCLRMIPRTCECYNQQYGLKGKSVAYIHVCAVPPKRFPCKTFGNIIGKEPLARIG